jgi:hypothetical protein
MAAPRKEKMLVQTQSGPQMRDCVEVEIKESNEPWSKYTLEDGTHITLKQVAIECWRVIDEFDPIGNPIYFFKGSMVTNATVPQSLKRKTN